MVSWKDAADREGLCRQRGLGDAHDEPGGHREAQLQAVVGLARIDPGLNGPLGVLELNEIDGGPAEQAGIPCILHADLTHHLPGNDLDVLVVDINALLTIGFLHLLDKVVVHRMDAADPQHIGGI